MIVYENGKYTVYSESGRRFGTYNTKEQAKKRLAQIEMFKHMKKQASINKLAVSPEFLTKVLTSRLSKINTKGVEDYAKLSKQIDRMHNDYINMFINSNKIPSKDDYKIINILKNFRQNVGAKFMEPNPKIKINKLPNN